MTEPRADGAKLELEDAGQSAASGKPYMGRYKNPSKGFLSKNDEQNDVYTCVVNTTCLQFGKRPNNLSHNVALNIAMSEQVLERLYVVRVLIV